MMKKIISLLSMVALSTSASSTLLTNQLSSTTLTIKQQNLKANNDISIEKKHRFFGRDFLKLKISYNIFLKLISIYDDQKLSQLEIRNYFFIIINNFPKYDYSPLPLLAEIQVFQGDIFTTVDVIIKHYDEINDFFKAQKPGEGILIATNTIGSWNKKDGMGVFSQ